MSYAPYEPPADVRDARPAVITWYRLYAALMALLAVAVLSLFALTATAPLALVLSAGTTAVFFAAAAFVPLKPWGWTFALVAIALGLAGVTVLVAAPLLVAWRRPTVKAAFARL